MRLIKSTLQLSASDLVNFLGCRHIVELDREVALGTREKPDWNQPALAILRQKGQEHEDNYIAHLRSSGLTVIDLSARSAAAVVEAMAIGYDIITQATFENDRWTGRADILRKVPGKSRFGNYSYEVEDTKLSLHTKAGTILQLCLYTDLLAEIQGSIPEKMYVVKPGKDFPTESYRFREFHAYYRLIKGKFEDWLSSDRTETYPIPVERCDTCRWWRQCDRQRRDDDHLSLVAGLQNAHLKELESQEIKTLEQYAREKTPFRKKPEKGNPETYKKLHGQCKVQLKGREEDRMVYELLPFRPLRGLNRLPNPSKGDIYFDVEGDHFYREGGIEYLLGITYQNENNQMVYCGQWAKDRKEEKQAFCRLMEFVMERWKQFPDFYIYHYAPYEPSAIKRLASRHAVYEQEVDQLLRAERFIDLHAVIKESLQASVEQYSLKDLEKFTGYLREIDLRDAAAARRRIAAALELQAQGEIVSEDQVLVERYNEDDCRATEALHRWLENIFQEQKEKGAELARPELKTGDASEKVDERDEYARKLRDDLVTRLPDDVINYSPEDKAKWLLAHMVDYFRRENRVAWWEYFRLHEMEDEELLDERHGIAMLQFEKEIMVPNVRTPVHRYRFPPQEISANLSGGTSLTEIKGEEIGSVHEISVDEGWIAIKKKKATAGIHPTSVHVGGIIPNRTLADSLHAFTESVINQGLENRESFSAAKDLLLKNPPRLQGNMPLVIDGEKMEEAALRISTHLDNSILPIQGPPGTGKTYIGALMIVELVKQGKRVGVTAVSHKVIRNLLDKALELGQKAGVSIQCGHRTNEESEALPDGMEELFSNPDAFSAVIDGKVVGGTSWLWAREDAEGTLDYLFVDEAGQMSLCNVIACSRAARNIILLGDPQQLEQPQQGAHPEGADVSALNHLLDGKKTMPEDKGLFLGTTWRLPQTIAAFTSEQYYEDRLKSKPELEHQRIIGDSPFAGSGLFYAPSLHEGNQNKAPEEIETIVRLVDTLLKSDLRWSNRDREEKPLTDQDILIVAPYNAQVSALIDRLPGMRIGTVDKFQGQEAPVVIYSMTSSSPVDAPRGMSFLYNPNRLNVATSRAQCISILVGSPALFEPECHSVDQMRWANGLCRYREMATEVAV